MHHLFRISVEVVGVGGRTTVVWILRGAYHQTDIGSCVLRSVVLVGLSRLADASKVEAFETDDLTLTGAELVIDPVESPQRDGVAAGQVSITRLHSAGFCAGTATKS